MNIFQRITWSFFFTKIIYLNHWGCQRPNNVKTHGNTNDSGTDIYHII